MFDYLRLYRIDVALIAFFSYLIGSEIGATWKYEDILIASAISLISTNFIYSFNSWADCEIDKKNKPWRPLPSGKIKSSKALLYSMILLILSLIYPFFIFKSYFTLFLFLLIPFLGIIYSARPVRLRRYSIPSVIIISIGLITPVTLGYFMNTDDTSLYPIFIILFIYCLGIVPFKDIEDRDGDIQNNMENLFARLGKVLLLTSICTLLINLVLIFIFSIKVLIYKIFLLLIVFSSFILVFIWYILQKDLKNLYQILIYTFLGECIIIYIILYLFQIKRG